MLKSALLLVGSGSGARLIQLLRSAIIARVVTVEDFGIIATFALATNMMQMVSDFALDRMVVQHRQGDDPKFIAALQMLQVIRGALGGLLLFLLAGPYSRLMGVDDLIWPYQVLALFPLITGFISLDLYRPQRHGRFGAYARWQMIGPIASLAILGVLLVLFDDWRIGLCLTLLGQTVTVMASHLMAERRMRLSLDWPHMREALRFGWPLMLTAIVLYVVLNGDRIIVSKLLGLEQLAFFTIAIGMAQIPVSVLSKAHQYVFLSELSRHRDDPEAFAAAVRLSIQSRMALAIAMAVLLALVGPDLTTLVYGEKYALVGGLVIWTGLYHAMRMLKGGPGTVAISKARTKNPLMANLPCLLALPVGFVAVSETGSLVALVVIVATGEFIGYLLSLWLLRRYLGGLPRGIGSATLLTLGVFALVALDVVLHPPQPALFANFHTAQIGLVLAGAAAVLCMGTLRGWIWRRVRLRIPRRSRPG